MFWDLVSHQVLICTTVNQSDRKASCAKKECDMLCSNYYSSFYLSAYFDCACVWQFNLFWSLFTVTELVTWFIESSIFQNAYEKSLFRLVTIIYFVRVFPEYLYDLDIFCLNRAAALVFIYWSVFHSYGTLFWLILKSITTLPFVKRLCLNLCSLLFQLYQHLSR